ncbi:hypothetical protein NQ317_000964 [Molorchus minor]|uniref:Uncharacterized protein n=1 Tax=Molorchus minor TaxID=1323400 RepID=A0ABQ9IWX3_9CUCU|nr:hypothetical protein NQ317_000964 [Molorchus minor]
MVTIPRLELCAALVLAQIVNKVKIAMKKVFEAVYLWSDSTVVLGWIRTSSNLLNTFVANRVSQIQTLSTSDQWHHVNTKSNPADLLSRWWYGPQWLCLEEQHWPHSEGISVNELPEPNRASIFTSSASETCFGILLAIHLKMSTKSIEYGPLTASELEYAQMCLVEISQEESFHSDIQTLNNSKQLSSRSNLLNLYPFVDTKGNTTGWW